MVLLVSVNLPEKHERQGECPTWGNPCSRPFVPCSLIHTLPCDPALETSYCFPEISELLTLIGDFLLLRVQL